MHSPQDIRESKTKIKRKQKEEMYKITEVGERKRNRTELVKSEELFI